MKQTRCIGRFLLSLCGAITIAPHSWAGGGSDITTTPVAIKIVPYMKMDLVSESSLGGGTSQPNVIDLGTINPSPKGTPAFKARKCYVHVDCNTPVNLSVPVSTTLTRTPSIAGAKTYSVTASLSMYPVPTWNSDGISQWISLNPGSYDDGSVYFGVTMGPSIYDLSNVAGLYTGTITVTLTPSS